jgi:hypothetical protein
MSKYTEPKYCTLFVTLYNTEYNLESAYDMSGSHQVLGRGYIKEQFF